MSIKNTVTNYGSVAKFLHWTVALLVFVLIPVGFLLDDIKPPFHDTALSLHKSAGLTVLLLMMIRLLWRKLNTVPKFAADTPLWQAVAANWSHRLLYAVLFIMPLSGWTLATAHGKPPTFWGLTVMPFPYVPVSTSVSHIGFLIHEYCAWLIIAAVSLHIMAAFEHLWIRRDNIYQRMMPDFLKKKTFYDQ